MGKTYSAVDFEQIIAGDAPLPNFEPISPAEFCKNIAAVGHGLNPKWGWSRSDFGYKAWAQYFLNVSDGSGYVCVYGPREPKVGHFAICKHEKKAAPDANPSRGWHPGHCVKCGLDMTVDSGD